MEERHGAIHHVGGRESETAGRPGDPPLSDPHRLGCPGGARGEQQQGKVVRRWGERLGFLAAGDGRRVVNFDNPGRPEFESLEQGSVPGIGEDDRTVGVHDVGGQFIAPPGRVQADEDRSRQDCRPKGEEVLGDVVKQNPHMGRPTVGED
jgi:hypothetical protein